jgi:restriction endonuclease S subunit
MELSHFVSIRTGIVFSRKQASPFDCAVEYYALNLKAVSDEGTIDREIVEPYYASARLKPEFLTRERDVLLRLSAPYTAVWVSENDIDLLVPAHFAIIRTKPRLLDAHYLYWWLAKNRRNFYKMASGGTMMGTISSGYIAEMNISPPPIEQQRQMSEYLRLTKREQRLLTRLAAKKHQLADAILHQIEIGGYSK